MDCSAGVSTNRHFHPPLLFLEALNNEQYLKLLEEHTDSLKPKREEILLCAKCQQKITTPKDKTSINNTHRHFLTNPFGIAFDVGCFENADGCLVFGESTSAHSWFPDYVWQYAHCKSCEIHLGWLFMSSTQDRFFGLVLNKLASQSQ